MSEHHHERDHEHGHIPPPDLHRQKRILGFRPLHVVIGAIVLVILLLIYLLLIARAGY
ncbi:MAG TPA: hypothetical protein VNU92_15370 [Edaphobacter sp.]|nr:hypothetical protein [Edaphobacter sp.]